MQLGRPGRFVATIVGTLVALLGLAWMLSGGVFFWSGAVLVAIAVAWLVFVSPPSPSIR